MEERRGEGFRAREAGDELRGAGVASSGALGVAGPVEEGEEFSLGDALEAVAAEGGGEVAFGGEADGGDGAEVEGQAEVAGGGEAAREGVLEGVGGGVVGLAAGAGHAGDGGEEDEEVEGAGQVLVEVQGADCFGSEDGVEVRGGCAFEEAVLDSLFRWSLYERVMVVVGASLP